MAKLDRRHLGHSQLAGSEQAAVTGDDAAIGIDEHRVGEAELSDRRGDLRHLGIGVCARVASVGDQLGNRHRFV